MGNMNSQVVVLVVIIAAGAAVLIGYATTRYFVGRVPDGDTEGPGSDFNQAKYMREVRLRNSEQLAGMNVQTTSFGMYIISTTVVLQLRMCFVGTSEECCGLGILL
jgi:hypothetical protein